MPQAQRFDPDHRDDCDLSVSERSYFGAELDRIDEFDVPVDPEDPRQPYRHSYVYQAVYNRRDDYGGIQLRARVHTLAADVPEELTEWLRESAHRAGFMYDSGIETRAYGPAPSGIRGTAPGDGYLTGFNPVKTYQNTETEAVEDLETQPGVVDWSVEVYIDDNFDYASLSGIAQGVSYPYEIRTESSSGRPPVDIPGTKWEITYNEVKDGGRYDVHPKGDTSARRRYQTGAGAGKTVYINDKPVGSLDQEGRVWLAPEYAGDPNTTSGSWGTYWSREGLVDETDATYQALSRNGRLYQTGETSEAVFLKTAREVPDGWKEANPDNVPEDLEADAGAESFEWKRLALKKPTSERHARPGDDRPEADPLTVECRRDDEIISHMGMSSPAYSHTIAESQRWEA